MPGRQFLTADGPRHQEKREAGDDESQNSLQRAAGARRRGNLIERRRGFRREVLSRIDEAVVLDSVLFVVELAIPSVQGDELRVTSPLDDLSVFEHENLVGALDGREAMGDHESRSAPTKGAKSVAD